MNELVLYYAMLEGRSKKWKTGDIPEKQLDFIQCHWHRGRRRSPANSFYPLSHWICKSFFWKNIVIYAFHMSSPPSSVN
jgi:hypothetical protein